MATPFPERDTISLPPDGRPLDEDYLAGGTSTLNLEPTTVPDGMVFLLSDNRTNAQDSRFFGPVPEGAIVGRAVLTTSFSLHRVALIVTVDAWVAFVGRLVVRATPRARAPHIDLG